jgi:hypothetical protein
VNRAAQQVDNKLTPLLRAHSYGKWRPGGLSAAAFSCPETPAETSVRDTGKSGGLPRPGYRTDARLTSYDWKHCCSRGGMCERLKQAVLKTALPERVTGVRIPLPPPSTWLTASVKPTLPVLETSDMPGHGIGSAHGQMHNGQSRISTSRGWKNGSTCNTKILNPMNSQMGIDHGI